MGDRRHRALPACMQRNFSFLKEDLHGWRGVAFPVQQTVTERERSQHDDWITALVQKCGLSSSLCLVRVDGRANLLKKGQQIREMETPREMKLLSQNHAFATQLRVQPKPPKSQSNSNCITILCFHSLPSSIYTLRKHDGGKATGSAVWSAWQRANSKTDPEAQAALAAVLYWF